MSVPPGCDGRALPLQVTLPNNANEWQLLAVFYGYVPWVICLLIAVAFLVYRGSREVSVGLLPALTAGINELVKMGVNQNRPVGSCLTSKGMPSSHSAVSIGLFLFLILDAAYRLRPSGAGIFGSCKSMGDTAIKMLKGVLVLPFGSLTRKEFFGYAGLWAILLIPVPLSRVLLNDHSPSQAMAGSLIGILAAGIWFPLTLLMRSKWQEYVGRKYLKIFVHNYDVPEGWDYESTDGETDPIVDSSNQKKSPENIV
jgi:membrane-associated phospholipid phosphatase